MRIRQSTRATIQMIRVRANAAPLEACNQLANTRLSVLLLTCEFQSCWQCATFQTSAPKATAPTAPPITVPMRETIVSDSVVYFDQLNDNYENVMFDCVQR